MKTVIAQHILARDFVFCCSRETEEKLVTD